jgi:1,2-phenylacetyl-CoA epoxidase PaaB subunit
MTYGRIHDLSAAEIEAAVATYRRKFPERPAAEQIQIVSSSEIRIYLSDSACCYSTMERKHGAWQFGGDQILWTE